MTTNNSMDDVCNFRQIKPADRERYIQHGVILRATKSSGYSRAYISKTFAGDVKFFNLEIVLALYEAMAEIDHEHLELAKKVAPLRASLQFSA